MKRSITRTAITRRKKKAHTRLEMENQRYLRELQMRQTELEAQNMSLTQARAEAEAAYRQYTDLYDFAPLGYLTLACDGTILQANLAGSNLLGVEYNELSRLPLGIFVSSESLPIYNVFFEKLLLGREKETCELAFEKKGGGLVWARLEATSFEGSNLCRVTLTDITERKKMASLLQARVRISEFVESHTFDELLQKTLDEAEQITGSQIGFAHFLEPDQKTLKLQMWSTNTLENMCSAEGKGSHYPVDQAGVWATCVYTRKPQIHNDYSSLAHRKGLPDGHAPIIRELVVPVLRNELIVMIMGIGNKLTDYDDNDVEILSQLADSTWDIVQRKKAEDALRTSERKYRLLHESMIDGFASVDMNGIFLECNDIYRNMLGYSEDEIYQLSYVEITSKKWRAFEAEIVENQILKRGYSNIYEKEYIRKDGTIFPAELHTVLIRDELGNPAGMWAIVRDITERKRIENSLRASELKFRALAENIPSVIYQRRDDEGFTFLYLNNAVEELTGYPPGIFLEDGLSFLDIYHPDDLSKIKETISTQADINHGSFHITYRIRHKSGEWRWVDEWGIRVLNDQGILQYLEGILIDITERKQAEEALRESNDLFSLFMFHSPVYAFIKEVEPTESRVLQASDNFQQLTGIPGLEMVGKTMEELFPPELAAKFTEDDWSVITSGEVLRIEEIMNNHHYTTIKFPISLGERNLLAGYTIDITERVQAETALQESELFVKDVLNSLTAHIAVLNEKGVIVAVNEAWRNYGHENGSQDANDFVGTNYLTACQTAIREGDPVAWQVDRSIRAVLKGSQQQFNTEYQCDSPALQRWFTITVLPQHRSRQGVIIIHQDITERKLGEQALAAVNKALQTALIREQELAHTDALTGINNRRRLYELAEREFEIAVRYQQPLSVIMFDIDHFKKVNDTFGHAAGDQILQQVTRVACSELRSADVIGRYGGEEFVIILPMTNAQQAYPLAERIRAEVGSMRVPTEKGEATVTLSMGIVELNHGTKNVSVENLIRFADKVMYTAKQAGRNRTLINDQLTLDSDNE